MPGTDQQMPLPNRPSSEIAFVLRRAKWRRGPEVLRDLAKAQYEEVTPTPVHRRSNGERKADRA